jgi:hypothetical protein
MVGRCKAIHHRDIIQCSTKIIKTLEPAKIVSLLLLLRPRVMFLRGLAAEFDQPAGADR